MSEPSKLISRRSVLSAGMTVGAAVAVGAASRSLAADAPIAKTAYGRVRGVTQEDVHVFKSIPYGASTAGVNRFKPPVAPQPWTNVRDALAYGPSTLQSNPQATRTPSASADFIGELSDRPESEDCLVLNIWTRGLADNAKRPVMFWIHGGGFTTGSGSSPGYDGVNLCQRGDVVVVTINHRLNVTGFAYFGDLHESFAGVANVGMLDIVHALKWVKENIENFGGDPNRVMIFGESGGGRKVGTLLAMPAAKGLFHRAVMQSGATLQVVSRENGTLAAQALIDELKMSKADLPKIGNVPAAQLMAAYFSAARKHRLNQTTTGYAPVVDGTVLPQHPFHPNASPLLPDVPVIIGTNRTEMTLQLAGDEPAFNLDSTGLETRAKELLGDKAQEVLAIYKRSVPKASPSELFFLMVSDLRYCAPIMKIAERRAAAVKAPVYFYYFAWETPVNGGRMRSAHALEIPFVFDNTEISKRFTGGGARPAALADKMADAWIAFARSGSPDIPKLPKWEPYTATQRATLVLNDTTKLEIDPTRDRRAAMQGFLKLS